MRRCFEMALLAAIVAASLSCEQTGRGGRATPGRKAAASATPGQGAAAREAAPLLLLDDGPEEGASSANLADNSRCHVCHLNYAKEDLAVSHARAGIGCARCHGESDAHIDDESWASGGNGTAPDVMYPPNKINPSCLGCHPQEKIPTDEHKAFLAGRSPEKVCTDCHGEHRLHKRQCKWK